MNGHNLGDFIGPGLASCNRCHQVLDVYEWSEPCEPVTARIPAIRQGTGRAIEVIPLVAA